MSKWIVIPSTNVLISLAGMYSLLLIVTLVTFFKKKRNSQKDYTEIVLRIKTFWIIVLLLGLSFILSPGFAIVFWALVSFLALKEYLTMIPTRRIDRRILFWAYASIPVQYYWIAYDWYNMFAIFIPVFVFLFLPLRMVMLGDPKGFVRAVGMLHWGIMMMVYCLSCLAALYLPDEISNPVAGSVGLILYLLFLNQFNDAAQYFWGKKLGKHKIIPTVSPNKTLEGFIGGVITTVLLALLLAPYLTPLKPVSAFFVGLMISCAGFIGDIIVSALKRDLGVKDTGQLLPGHGGILDRIDSLVFTAPLYFHFLRYFSS